MRFIYFIIVLFVEIVPWAFCTGQTRSVRKSTSLDNGWMTIADRRINAEYSSFMNRSFNDGKWKKVDVPHNWDSYEGYRRMIHGNRHGYAWYRKVFRIGEKKKDHRYFLWFEGVGSYANVWINGRKAGFHAGGRTSFTLDITDLIWGRGKANVLAVRADHPANIRDLPWVDGGCSEERGFSEGSQPMGIFRPVHLIETNTVRIEPFGIHVWNDTTVTDKSAQLHLETTFKNYSERPRSVIAVNKLYNREGLQLSEVRTKCTIAAEKTLVVRQESPVIEKPRLWSPEDPYLYTVVSQIVENGKVIDESSMPYGIRWIRWPMDRGNNDKRFYVNGKPVFINGVAEYEHLIGQSHAFSEEQVRARVMMVKTAGFNAFRDAHQPHNLRYQDYWDKLGILWWPQMAAHIWFDTPAFRNNFKTLLTDWVKERRNSPSVILWGLENESTLPEDFARECSDLIRQLDPTASVQRKITTCNGGKGTDWDVPQNWTGTYGGNPSTYGEDMQRQILIGEYGAWRTLDLHTEGPFNQNGIFSEDRMAQLTELKLRLADSVKDKTSGHFFWLLTSHDNPGRVQGGEGLRELDRVGPVNYKGLLTPWEEPLDVYYLFRSNFAPVKKEPMVYIVSHTWPDRWITGGKKDGITVYSNCEEVELFNDLNNQSLGRKRRGGIGTHFQWNDVTIRYNVLYAVGYVGGKIVARDTIVLHHLPRAPHFEELYRGAKNITRPQKNYKYLYRVNCGGPDFRDQNGNIWLADRHLEGKSTWGSKSWTDDFPGMPSFFASQRRTTDPIKGTLDWPLFQTFRYGRDKLSYEFPVSDGEYLVELYFIEPWFGTGGGMDCTGWRVFDVAVNGHKIIKDLDIWKEAGHDGALKKTFKVHVAGGRLTVSFPSVRSGQAILSAIAIASASSTSHPAAASPTLIRNLRFTGGGSWKDKMWLDTGDRIYTDSDELFSVLPSNLYGAEWLSPPSKGPATAVFESGVETDVFIGLPEKILKPEWMNGYEDTHTFAEDNRGTRFNVFRKRFREKERVLLGENKDAGSKMYIAAVLPATSLQPAYDLKPTTTYKAFKADLTAGIVKSTVNEKDAVTFSNAAGEQLAFTISVGVADTYSLTIKYANTGSTNLKARLQLLEADGTLLKEELVEFAPSKAGKWNYLNSSSGSMINAGSYKVKLIAIDAKGLSISGLDVQ